MDCYWLHENLIADEIKKEVYQALAVPVLVYSLDSKESLGGKARRRQHMDATCRFEQILEAETCKTAVVWPLTSYHWVSSWCNG